MNSVELLSIVSAPFVSLIADPKHVAEDALNWQASGLVVRAIRGPKVRTLDGLFDEFAAALQFPYYFGGNWAAFRDCVSDLDWLHVKAGVVVVIYGAGEVLADAHPAEMTTLVKTLTAVSEEFADAVTEGEWWDRDPVPFHVVLQGHSEEDFERWRHAGAAPGSWV